MKRELVILKDILLFIVMAFITTAFMWVLFSPGSDPAIMGKTRVALLIGEIIAAFLESLFLILIARTGAGLLFYARKKTMASIGVTLLIVFCILLAVCVLSTLSAFLFMRVTAYYNRFHFMYSVLLLGLLSLIYLIVFVLHRYSKEYSAKEIEWLSEQKKNLEYEQLALKYKTDNHFLLNGLSILSSLIDKDREKASAFLKSLCSLSEKITRVSDLHLITLFEEFEIIDNYLDLMNIRTGNAIRVNIDRKLKNMDADIVPLALQLLIENAIKHNAYSEESPLLIDISETDGGVRVRNRKRPVAEDSFSMKTGLKILSDKCMTEMKKAIEVENGIEFFSVTVPIRYE